MLAIFRFPGIHSMNQWINPKSQANQCVCSLSNSILKRPFFQASINTDNGFTFQVSLQARSRNLIFSFCDLNSYAFSWCFPN